MMRLKTILEKKLIIVLGMFLLSFDLNGQTIIDIEVDNIYLNDKDIVFCNKGEVNEYSCEVISIRQNDYHYQLILDCEDAGFSLSDSLMINQDDILKFATIADLDMWVREVKFESQENRVNNGKYFYLQQHSNNLFSLLEYRKPFMLSDRVEFYEADFWRFVYFRINKKYYIIGLVDENASVFGYIIPTKNGAIATDGDDFYHPFCQRFDSVEFVNKWDFDKFYRIKKEKGACYLYDKLFNEKIINRPFKNIRFSQNFIICMDENETLVYDTQLKKKDIKNLKAACDSNYVTQFIIGNKIKWMDFEGKFHDTFPKPELGLCGANDVANRVIRSSNLQFKEISKSRLYGMVSEEIDSTYLSKADSIVSIRYLNNEVEHKYDSYSKLYSVFSFPYNTYLLKTPNNTKLVSLIVKNEAYKNDLTDIKEYQIQSQIAKDSLTNVINNIKDDIEITTLFEGDIEAFGYYHPIRFKEKNLYGYYPQNKKAKYLRLEKFNFFYAEFELPNGKKGWLDIYGNEYFRD
ncbi:MAG TPA: hypothetical protein PKD51_07555 [Saprospiraceae bacterium]|nr:hypothetical protein [Saprospiraceae bacterium]